MSRQFSFLEITMKTIVVHTVTYFLAGIWALVVFDYGAQFADPDFSLPMRQLDDPLVRAGVLFQPLRGLLFGAVFYALRSVLFRPKDGWLIMWMLLVFVGIFSTFGPAPASIEGLVYLTIPWRDQLGGISEIMIQSFVFAFVLYIWVAGARRRWLDWLLGLAFGVILLLAIMGLIFA